MIAFMRNGKFLKFKIVDNKPTFIEVSSIDLAYLRTSVNTVGLGELVMKSK